MAIGKIILLTLISVTCFCADCSDKVGENNYCGCDGPTTEKLRNVRAIVDYKGPSAILRILPVDQPNRAFVVCNIDSATSTRLKVDSLRIVFSGDVKGTYCPNARLAGEPMELLKFKRRE